MMKKRIVCLLLVVCMVVSMLPMQAFAADNAANPFTDVKSGDWFAESVDYVRQNGFFGGVSDTLFDPSGTMTRGMFVTVLGRMAGVDTSAYAGTSDFDDVDAKAYYAPYVAWAAKHGITDGTGEKKFSPDALINREMMATFFVRYFEKFEISYEVGTEVTTTPADMDSVSPFAREAVLKLWKWGLLGGDGVNFNPKGNATRAQAATLCTRLDQAIESWYQEPGVLADRCVKASGDDDKPAGSNTVSNANAEVSFSLCAEDAALTVTLPENKTYRTGTAISTIPTPYLRNTVFMGWYYDENKQKAVETNDAISGDMTLYADMASATALSEGGSATYVTSTDVETSFTVTLSAAATAGDYTVTEISNQNADVTASTAIAGGVVSASAGWAAGATYRLTVNDPSVLIYYHGEAQDAAVRQYNFTVYKAETENLSLSSDLRFIAAASVPDLPAAASGGLYAMTVNADGGTGLTAGNSTGTFTYNAIADEDGTPIAVGDTVAIYSGTRPDRRDLTTANGGDVAYLTITAIQGATYTYKTADSEDVIATPDVLPLDTAADTDGEANNHSVTVPNSALDYSGDSYNMMGLDSRTTADVGDYLALYTGDMTDQNVTPTYACITSVAAGADETVITYVDASQADVIAAMDIHHTEDSEIALSADKKEEIEADMETQAIESGFVDEAAEYLTSIALQTDGFTELSDDLELQSITATKADGSAVTEDDLALMGEAKVEIKDKKADAHVTTKLEHFTDSKGLRAEMSLSFKVIVNPEGENQIEINVTAIFEQEVLLTLSVDGGAIWKWAFIIPYIYDYRLTANMDIGTFTGIGVTATAVTKSGEDEDFDFDVPTGNKAGDKIRDIGKQIKELMDAKEELENAVFGESAGSNSGGLADKYAAMMENESDWVELFTVNLFETEGFADPFHILCYGVSGDFVVSANMNISLGMTFEYGNAKRYSFSLMLFHKKSTNETIDLEPEHYQFDFYVMGTLGIRAGVRLKVAVGLFSLKLDSIGITAEAGAYAQLWGYFYYSLSWDAATNQKNSAYSGALYLEVGVYLEIDFLAQAFNSTFAYNPTLYEKTWPLWSAGAKENVSDFAYSQEDAPEISWVKINSVTLPRSVFYMNYMDLTSGEEGSSALDDSKFTIRFSNPAFTYDKDTDTLSVDPDGTVKQEGEMTLILNAPLAFTSQPIERTIKLLWRDPTGGYYLNFDSKGGSYVDMLYLNAGQAVTRPADPEKLGYTFGGWLKDGAPYTLPATMPKNNITVTANWIPRTDINYTVVYHKQNLSGVGYTEVAAVTYDNGVTDSLTSFTPATYKGFHMVKCEHQIVKPDGSAVVNVYYDRDEYTVTFSAGPEGTADDTYSYTKLYGSTIYAPFMALGGYVFDGFSGWPKNSDSITLTGNISYTAVWTPDPNTPFRVEHYVQSPDHPAQYLLLGGDSGIQSCTGATGTSVSPETYKLADAGLSYVKATVGGENVTTAKIAGDGKMILKLYYNREKYALGWNLTGGTLTAGTGTAAGSVSYGAPLTAPTVETLAGYTFSGWYTDAAYANAATITTMPAVNTTYYGKMIPNTTTAYKVEHYKQDVSGTGYTLADTDERTGTTGTDTAGAAKDYTGFTAKAFSQVKIAGEGTTVLKLYYDRNKHALSWNVAGGTIVAGTGTAAGQLGFGTPITKPTISTLAGYTFSGWFTDSNLTAPAQIVTMPNADASYYGKMLANTTTPYKVEHYQQNLSGAGYTVSDTDELTGTTDTDTAGASKAYTGFAVPTISQEKINGAGTTILKLYYDRLTHDAVFDAAGGSSVAKENYRYEARVATPAAPTKQGFDFLGWTWAGQAEPQKAIADVKMGLSDITFTANWQARTDTPYKVETYLEGISTGYAAAASSTQNLTGTTGQSVAIEAPAMTGFTFDSENSKNVTSGDLAANGSLTLKLYYKRNSYVLSWDTMGGAALTGVYTKGDVLFGQTITPPADPTRAGYDFTGWNNLAATMPAGDTDCQAQWRARADTSYRSEYQLQNIAGDGYDLSAASATLRGTTQAEATSENKTFEGFTFDAANEANRLTGAIAGDGSLVLTRYYKRNSHAITYHAEGGTVAESSKQFVYGGTLSHPAVSRDGWNFGGWFTDSGFTTQFSAGTMPDHDLDLYAKWVQTSCTVEHYIMGTDGTYSATASYTDTISGEANTEYTAADLANTNYLVANGISYDHATVSGGTVTKFNLTQGLVVKLFYARARYNLTWSATGATLGGSYTNGMTYYGASIVKPTLTRTGYTCAWGTDVAATMPTEDQTYTATMTPDEYGATFEKNFTGAATAETITQTYDASWILPATDPIRTGYEFLGWFNQMSGGTKLTAADKVNLTAPKTYYAQWRANNDTAYTVKHMKQSIEGAYILADTEDLTGITAAEVTPSRKSYEGFTAPVGQTVAIQADGSTVVTYNYTRNTYNVSWNVNGGNSLIGAYTTGATKFEAPVASPADPTRDGYDFGGWDTTVPSTMPAKALAFTAKWQAKEYTVSFSAGVGSACSDQSVTFDHAYGALPTTSCDGYDFLGWFTQQTGGSKVESTTVYATAGQTTLYAHWSTKSYTITCNLAGGVTVTSNPTSYDVTSSEITLVNPTRGGYTFAGWTGTDLSGAVDAVAIATGSTGNRTYTATWTANTYTLNFNACGGTVTPAQRDVTYGSTYGTAANQLPTPTKTGYDFLGWYTLSTGGTKMVETNAYTTLGDSTLYAHWQLLNYTITCNLAGGVTATDNLTSYQVTSSKITLVNPTRNGYTFAGWTGTDLSGATTTVNIAAGSTGNRTYTATWTADAYAITYDLDGGTAGENHITSYTAETSAGAGFSLVQPTKSGYTFAGWQWNGAGTKPETVTISDDKLNVTIAGGTMGALSFKALWAQDKDRVYLDLAGGSITSANVDGTVSPAIFSFQKGSSHTLAEISEPTRSGYLFNGWTVVNGGGSRVDAATVLVNGATYQAMWLKLQSGAAVVSTQEDLSWAIQRASRNGSSWNGATIKLGADLTLDSTWQQEGEFSGTLDGNGHTLTFSKQLLGNLGSTAVIRNLVLNANLPSATCTLASYSNGTISNVSGKIKMAASDSCAGGMVYYNRGTIQNCTVELAVSSSMDYLGGIAYVNTNTGTIDTCTIWGSVTGSNNIGGYVVNNEGKIQNCLTSTGSGAGESCLYVKGTDSVGGIAAVNKNNAVISSTLTSPCKLKVKGGASGSTVFTKIGGIAGQNDGTIRGISITKGGTASDIIEAQVSNQVGGIAGSNNKLVEGCTVNGTITAPGTYSGVGGASIGGIAGTSNGTVTDCSVTGGTISGSTSVGGLVGYLGYMGKINVSASGVNRLSGCTITGSKSIGGAVGYCDGASGSFYPTIAGVTSSATVTGNSGASEVGGLIGNMRGNTLRELRVTNCTLTGSTTGASKVGKIVGWIILDDSYTGTTNSSFTKITSNSSSALIGTTGCPVYGLVTRNGNPNTGISIANGTLVS